MKNIGMKLSLIGLLATSAQAADLGVLEPGNYANIVCSNREWRVATYSNGIAGEVEVVIDYRGQTIAQNVAKYVLERGPQGVSYVVDAGMGNEYSLRFRTDESMYGRGDFRRFGVYDIPSLSCEIGD